MTVRLRRQLAVGHRTPDAVQGIGRASRGCSSFSGSMRLRPASRNPAKKSALPWSSPNADRVDSTSSAPVSRVPSSAGAWALPTPRLARSPWVRCDVIVTQPCPRLAITANNPAAPPQFTAAPQICSRCPKHRSVSSSRLRSSPASDFPLRHPQRSERILVAKTTAHPRSMG